MTASVSQHSVATLAGVSQRTVSNVLSERVPVSERTRKQVLDAVAQLGYRTNLSARAIRTGRFNSVALLLGEKEHSSRLPDAMLRGIQAELAAHKQQLIVSRLADTALTDERRVPRILQESSCDGLLVNYTDHIPDAMRELIVGGAIPAIWMNSRQESDCVHPDDRDAGRLAVEELVAAGCRRLAYADFSNSRESLPECHYSVKDRQAGALAAAEAAGLAMEVFRKPLRLPLEERVEFARRILGSPDRPDGVVCHSRGTSIPLYLACVHAGMRVPQDLALVSIDGEAVREVGRIFTTVVLPVEEVGRRSAEALLRRIHDERALPPVPVPVRLEPGQTSRR